MKIANKIINDKKLNCNEVKFLLWCTLIQLSAYSDDVHTIEEESFNIERVLSKLDMEFKDKLKNKIED